MAEAVLLEHRKRHSCHGGSQQNVVERDVRVFLFIAETWRSIGETVIAPWDTVLRDNCSSLGFLRLNACVPAPRYKQSPPSGLSLSDWGRTPLALSMIRLGRSSRGPRCPQAGRIIRTIQISRAAPMKPEIR